jgi:hypothetical protein
VAGHDVHIVSPSVDEVEWAKASTYHDQVRSGEWEWWVSWYDGTQDRRVLFRLQRPDEARCPQQQADGSACCLPVEHAASHVPISASQAALTVIIDP